MRVKVLTIFYPVYHPHDLDKITCLLDEDGTGFTVTEASSPYFFNTPEIMESLHNDKHAGEFLNLATAHLVQLTDIAELSCRQLKQIHYIFPDKPNGETGFHQITCNDKYWNNKNRRIDSVPLSCTSTFQTQDDTENYFVRWTFTVDSSTPNVVKKVKSLSTKEKLVNCLKGKQQQQALAKSANMNTGP